MTDLRKKIITTFFVVAVFAASVCSILYFTLPSFRKSGNISAQSAAEFDTLIETLDKAPLLVDLRDPRDFSAGRINNFLNIPWKDDGTEFATWASAYKSSKLFILMDYDGSRAALAQARLGALGYTNVVTYPAGFEEYKAQKGKSYKPEARVCDKSCSF